MLAWFESPAEVERFDDASGRVGSRDLNPVRNGIFVEDVALAIGGGVGGYIEACIAGKNLVR